MSTLTEQLRSEIEATASVLGLKPSTIGARAGQGGKFYSRLESGLSVRTDTYETVMAKLQEMRASVAREKSHGKRNAPRKGQRAIPKGAKPVPPVTGGRA